MVSFQARDLDTAKSDYSKPLVFSDVQENEGGGYDPATGVFTCPTAGTYLFSATGGCQSEDGHVGAAIMVDDTYHSWFNGSSTCTGSSSVCVQLEVGQEVWVQAWSDVGQYRDDDACFTGALLQPLL